MSKKGLTPSESALLSEFSSEDKEFQNVLQNIVSVFASTRNRRIQELFEQKQEQNKELQTINKKLASQALELQIVQKKLEEADLALAEKTQLLEKQKKELALAAKYKSEFLANLSHELLTPMNSLLPLAQSLQENKEGNLTETQQQSADLIVDSGTELLGIIDKVLDLAVIEAGQVKKQVQEVALADLADNMENIFLHAAAVKGLAFRVTVDPGLPPTLFTDQRRLEQILKNLIDNSLKFTEQGKINLAFTQASEDIDFQSDTLVPATTLAVSVADTGIGIPSEKHKAVFEAFQQADGSTARKYGGMGLGLSISKQLATVLGGEIHLRSEPKTGAVFTLYLPLQAEKKQPKKSCTCGREPAEQKEQKGLGLSQQEDKQENREGDPPETQQYVDRQQHPEQQKSDQQHLTALAIEPGTTENDSKTDSTGINTPVEQREIITAFCRAENQNQGPIKKLLMMTEDTRIHSILVDFAESRDIEIVEAKTDLQAWNILRTQSIDCMVLDVDLPDYNGIELLKELSEDPDVSVPPVIIFSGRDLTWKEEEKLNKYSNPIILNKFCSSEQLQDEALAQPQDRGKEPDTIPELPEKKVDNDTVLQDKRILLVDDDMRNVFSLSAALRAKGMEVSVAEHGAMALDMLDQDSTADIMLINCIVAEIDGHTTVRKIRENKAISSLPIIALIDKPTKGDQEKCLQAGADTCLQKPIDAEQLFPMMQQLLYASL